LGEGDASQVVMESGGKKTQWEGVGKG
jgi:hypothetical protein